MRPAKESASLGRSRILAEAIRIKRPALRLLSTDIFILVNNSGTRCTSSKITNSGKLCMKPMGSASENWRCKSSSNEM